MPVLPRCSSRTTPKFPERVLPEGRAERGEAVLIPNLFPYDVYSSVIIMTDDHVVPLVPALGEEVPTTLFRWGPIFSRR